MLLKFTAEQTYDKLNSLSDTLNNQIISYNVMRDQFSTYTQFNVLTNTHK